MAASSIEFLFQIFNILTVKSIAIFDFFVFTLDIRVDRFHIFLFQSILQIHAGLGFHLFLQVRAVFGGNDHICHLFRLTFAHDLKIGLGQVFLGSLSAAGFEDENDQEHCRDSKYAHDGADDGDHPAFSGASSGGSGSRLSVGIPLRVIGLLIALLTIRLLVILLVTLLLTVGLLIALLTIRLLVTLLLTVGLLIALLTIRLLVILLIPLLTVRLLISLLVIRLLIPLLAVRRLIIRLAKAVILFVSHFRLPRSFYTGDRLLMIYVNRYLNSIISGYLRQRRKNMVIATIFISVL